MSNCVCVCVTHSVRRPTGTFENSILNGWKCKQRTQLIARVDCVQSVTGSTNRLSPVFDCNESRSEFAAFQSKLSRNSIKIQISSHPQLPKIMSEWIANNKSHSSTDAGDCDHGFEDNFAQTPTSLPDSQNYLRSLGEFRSNYQPNPINSVDSFYPLVQVQKANCPKFKVVLGS